MKPSLKRFAQEEAIYGNKSYDYTNLPFKIEYAFVKLLSKELDLGRWLQLEFSSLSLRKDFNIFELYNTLDNFKYNFIAKEKY